MQVALIALSTTLLLSSPQPGRAGQASADAYVIPNCLITLIQENEIPAQEAGVIWELRTPVLDERGNPVLDAQGQPAYQEVLEGLEVREGQLLGRIDDRLEAKIKEMARLKVDIANKEAENDVRVRYARATRDVAAAELDQQKEANILQPRAVALSELRRLALALEQATLSIEQATLDWSIAKEEVKVAEAEHEVADLKIDRRRFVAPFDGMIVQRSRHPGEWVQPGEPVLKIVRTNRVRIKGTVDVADLLPAEVRGQKVLVRLDTRGIRAPPGAEQMVISGRVGFVSPTVDGAGRFEVWADVDNQWVAPDPANPQEGDWLLRDGLKAEMTIIPKRFPGARLTSHAEER
jgi:multidrug efflux pump subunit AcrA (membrane-fusion protein)